MNAGVLETVEHVNHTLSSSQELPSRPADSVETRSDDVQSISADDAAQQRYILDSKNTRAAYEFAKCVPGADIQALQKLVLEYGEPWDAYQFAKFVKGADIPALQNVIIDGWDGQVAYGFAKDIAGADILALQRVAMICGDGECLYLFAEYVDSSDIPALEESLKQLHEHGMDDGWIHYFYASQSIQDRNSHNHFSPF